jgi:hypothetical protein
MPHHRLQICSKQGTTLKAHTTSDLSRKDLNLLEASYEAKRNVDCQYNGRRWRNKSQIPYRMACRANSPRLRKARRLQQFHATYANVQNTASVVFSSFSNLKFRQTLGNQGKVRKHPRPQAVFRDTTPSAHNLHCTPHNVITCVSVTYVMI